MSSFASYHVQSLLSAAESVPSTPTNEFATSSEENIKQSSREEKLYSLLLQLKYPLDKNAVHSTLAELHGEQPELSSGAGEAIRSALERKIVVGLYAEALDQWLKEARDADTEADWWDELARSSRSVAWYLLATFPQRLLRIFQTILDELRARDIPIRPSSFSPRALRELFPNVGSIRPTAIRMAFFPHLVQQQRVLLFSPLDLTRRECRKRHEELLRLRDERALQLGQLLLLKPELERALREESPRKASKKLQEAFVNGNMTSNAEIQDPITVLHDIAFSQLASHSSSHSMLFASLRRPSRLTLVWPQLALIPPVTLLILRMVYNSRDNILESVLRAHDTVKGFWFGYVVEPVRGILETVRTGGDDGARIINQQAVRADLESLERMAVDLTKDRLSLNESEVQQLSERIRQGDLTPVLRIYEEDIKTPVRTALTGNLIRSLLIQIQKAKVDLDQALSGIDKLLKSQELTFGFVGVAPALALIYAMFSGVQRFGVGSRGEKKYGGRREREGAWHAIRHVERLLITSSSIDSHPSSPGLSGSVSLNPALPALTSGLLLIAVARLREFTETRLPTHSLLRSGMLSDIVDLESPTLGQVEKLRVIERMWRSWGKVLGWDQSGRL